MTIVLTGGGSGGHITPLLAVAAELKKQQPKTRIIYIGQRGDNLGDIPAKDPNIDEVFTVRAGKFRRYHGEGLRQLLDISTMIKNIRDVFYVLVGTWQSWRLMKQIRPAIIFSRGGFVSVPVSLGGKLCGVPYITHDSDPIPSLANRIIAPWARLHAVALPKEIYSYTPNKTVTTGIPLNEKFVPLSPILKQQYRAKLKIPEKTELLFVIGGGLGSQIVNLAVAEAVPHLLHEYPKLQVVQVVGRGNFTEMQALYAKELPEHQQDRVLVLDFISDVYLYSGAADVIITRAGATNLAEFAVQGKACIVIPSSFLTAGHQLKSAEYLEEQQAAVVITEEDLRADPNRLAKQVSELFKDPKRQAELAQKLAKFAKPNAASELAKIIREQANSK